MPAEWHSDQVNGTTSDEEKDHRFTYHLNQDATEPAGLSSRQLIGPIQFNASFCFAIAKAEENIGGTMFLSRLHNR